LHFRWPEQDHSHDYGQSCLIGYEPLAISPTKPERRFSRSGLRIPGRYGKFTTPKSKKSRRVDLSRELRRALLELRDKRLLEAFMQGKTSIADELVFPSKAGTVFDPSNLFYYHFLPCLEHAGLRRFQFHDLRHTFGSLLNTGRRFPRVREGTNGHSSIQITVDTYGHLIPGANIKWVDGLDRKPSPQQNATPAQLGMEEIGEAHTRSSELIDYADNIGAPGRTRTYNQQIPSQQLNTNGFNDFPIV
jgi:hypothetical protein